MMRIRPVQVDDNRQLANLIREVMASFGAVGEGYSIEDPEVDSMAESYSTPRARYYVIEDQTGRIVGGSGIAQLQGGDPDTCELKKMYFYPEARGLGLGQKLLEMLEDDARERDFAKMYLETVDRMTQAVRFYERNGFQPLPKALGNTGHTKCGLFYVKNL